MEESLKKYLQIFAKLRIDRAHGVAPHKPILIISVLQLIQSNTIKDEKIYITPELVGLFKSNWSLLVTTNHDCRFALPFYHLTSDKFWSLIPKPSFENILMLKASMRSFANLNAATQYAIISDDLLKLGQNKESSVVLINFLLDHYFPNTKGNFYNSSNNQLKLFDDIEYKILNEPAGIYRNEMKILMQEKNEEEVFIRGSLFKREVPKIYNNTCCISGMKIDASISVSMIDACHIVPFSESYDDTITNGIALCPNLHRAFDRGLIAIDTNYKVVISSVFQESETNYSIQIFEKKQIKLPNKREHFPLIENFEWHMENVFKK